MKLIFVYNAKSDKLSSIVGFAHKIISPTTYNCNLCKLTHSNLGERKEWTNFIKENNVTIEFYHIDEFEKKFNTNFEYPVILNNNLKLILDNKAITKLGSVDNLITFFLVFARTKHPQ